MLWRHHIHETITSTHSYICNYKPTHTHENNFFEKAKAKKKKKTKNKNKTKQFFRLLHKIKHIRIHTLTQTWQKNHQKCKVVNENLLHFLLIHINKKKKKPLNQQKMK